ncbi:AfsR/SARP family transcriptional regulator [Streptomyces sp. AK02-01A]|uniref:AfsR/SARP family transcriptional regulator n=1 Tax=Streptomyces sp. AK02-01A TaxID=3028648 RepID=UPI0029B1F4C6|nr:BTAD domain-containing putative transcriptional regulator [Streptomyces sp. AK02-01A]MDX3849557.1 BTAD domain-containing putative transcriptional regulator [Streptomyces sp. AK02-01A]MDX3849873.1 BTAD domain-containing putative transcriptional regulator [Streptomyces sp. AK02-01A]
MRYRVLGTTRALHDDGTPVALGGTRLRALLTVLALRAGRTVPVGALVAEVWAGDPPADAVGALQALVGRLRRALGHEAVSSSDGGYRLRADEEDIDLHRFGRLAAEGARALEEGDAIKAAALLDDALALWQGPALADLPDRAPEAARWETRRLEARRARLTATLDLGRAEEALPELAALCDEFPLDEPLHALRIRALRDASRPAEALVAYDTVRRALANRLGTDPGPGLRALHQELLHAGDRTDERGSGPGPDRGERSGREDGPGGAVRRAGPAGGTADRRSPAPYGNLRARLTSFVGREADIEAIRDDLGRARLVTLLGPGGAGKTRLSQEAAERVADGWPDGVWLAELAPVDDPETVAEAVLTALGARETVLRGAGAEELRAADRHGSEPLVRLVEHCARRRMLLLLDNCEHVVEAAATLAEELLARCPELTVLATSREPLGVPGEVIRPVEPLPPDPAHRLFAERARAVRPGFDPADDPGAVAEICRRLDGLPLAIELAAARLRMLTPRRIADRLDDRFRLLTSGSRTVLPRQQTLRAVVDWSWDLLDAPERAVLRRLSVFAGGCDLTAAESVCGDGTADAAVGPREVAGLLGALIDKSLVVAAPSPDGDMRYRLLETVAEYAAERLDEAGDRAAAERRHLVHYRELARTTDPVLRGAGQRAGMALLRLEQENLRTALRRAVAARDEDEALVLVLSLAWFWQMIDLLADARQWSKAAAALGPDPFAPPARPAPPLPERCTDAPPPLAPEMLQEARRQVRLIEMVSLEREAHDWTSPERLAWLSAVATVYRPGLPQTCRFPGTLWFFVLMFTGEAEQLRGVLDETVRACEEFGYDWELAGALQMRANILANRVASAGDASRDADRSLAIYDRLGDAWGTAEALAARGEAREKRGDYALAAEDYTAAIGHAEGLGAQSQVAVLRSRLASALIETDRGDEGERILREVLAEGRDGAHEALAAARLFLAVRLGRTGRGDEAREQLEVLMEVFRSETLAVFGGFVRGILAWLDCEDGRYAEGLEGARAALETSLSPLSRMMAPEMAALDLVTAAWALSGLAGEDRERAAGRPDRARDAARLLGAYEVLLPEGHFRASMERELLTKARKSVIAALGEAAYEAGRAEGGGLTMEEAAALV